MRCDAAAMPGEAKEGDRYLVMAGGSLRNSAANNRVRAAKMG